MIKPKKTIQKIGEYELRIEEYPPEAGNKIWFELIDGKKRVIALVYGQRTNESYWVGDFRFGPIVQLTNITKTKIAANLWQSIEAHLRTLGITKIEGTTNSRFAKFMEKRGHKIVSEDKAGIRMEGNLAGSIKKIGGFKRRP
ncbi:MAG: hypothetical protein PHD95_04115 [Candidatus ainarchaeum sp.]|nr:hypothetical protein [Candidatus ainarchaeum sp.]